MTTALLALFLAPTLSAATVSGKTADGCTFQVINGVYMHSCDGKGTGGSAGVSSAPLAAAPPVTSESITSYSSVQLRPSPTSLRSAPTILSSQPLTSRPLMASSLEGQTFRSAQEIQEERLIRSLVERTFVSVSAGASSTKGGGAEGLGLGLSLGTNLDEFFGAELGYSFSRQDLDLGLDQRPSTANLGAERTVLSSQWPSVNSQTSPRGISNGDASLANHIFSAELQGHLTSVKRRLRPFLGAGVSWRSAQLEEEMKQPGLDGGVLRQSSLNAVGAAGAKLRVSRTVQLAFAFRYFAPLMKQESQLDAPQSSGRSLTLAPASRLEAADTRLTSASVTQLLGGVQVYF